MDFSKAIMQLHSVDVERIDSEISSKLNDPNWVKANNQYNQGSALGKNTFVSFTYNVKGATMIFAELKKRYEQKGWRVLVLQQGDKSYTCAKPGDIEFQLYR